MSTKKCEGPVFILLDEASAGDRQDDLGGDLESREQEDEELEEPTGKRHLS